MQPCEERLNFQFLTEDPFITGPGCISRSAFARSDSLYQKEELLGTLNSGHCSVKESTPLFLSLQIFSEEKSILKQQV